MKESINDVKLLKKGNMHMFVLYHSNGCGHCHTFKPIWERLTDHIKKSKLEKLSGEIILRDNTKLVFNNVDSEALIELYDIHTSNR